MQQQTTAGFHLSPQQKLLSQSASAPPAGLVLLLEGPLDSTSLHNAIQEIAARHEILRTSYPRSAGMLAPFQTVNEAASPELTTSIETIAHNRHRLTVRFPALSADLASLRNFFYELASAYAGVPTPETIQYADYSEWHNDLLQRTDEESAAAKSYWAQHDYSAIPPLLLPFQKKKPGPTRETVPIAAQREPDTLLAAWQILLWRLTGQAEIVVGRVVEGRNHEEFSGALGLYAKILPAYANFETDLTFAEAIANATRSREEAAPWEDYFPLDRPMGELTAGFRLEEKPVFQLARDVTFTVASRTAHTPFAMELRCNAAGEAELVYDSARFTRFDAGLIARRLALLIGSVPQDLAAELPVMEEEEQDRVFITFNRTAADYPRDRCFHQLFEAQAAQTPEAPALRYDTTQLTYAELNARANRIAHALRARGVKANVPVGLLVERSADMIVGLLGILKAGGCYVPLVPDHPKARLEYQLAETGAPVVLTQTGLTEFPGKTIYLDSTLFENESAANPPLNTTPEDAVYIIYTSGSTGIPKGVAVTHANLVNYSSFIVRRLSPAAWNFATVSTLAADLGNTCIFPSLMSGGCLHVIGFETAMNAALYASYNAAHAIDVLKITPSHLATLLDGAGAAVLPRKFLISGGEALSWPLLKRIQEANCAVINHYGPTEATIGCCTFDAAADVSEWSPATVPIGQPIDNDEVYILDHGLGPVPIGTGGELWIGGAGVARGYFNQPLLTALSFFPNVVQPIGNMYRTGDLARFLPTGDIEFLGRIDQQVKIRGFRVEPVEIEAALRHHPDIRQAVVLPEGGASLIAYAVAGRKIEASEWRAFLRDRLPEYMLPSRIVFIDAVPITPNGKIDTRALAALGVQQSEPVRESIGPRNPEEEKMAAIWSGVLKIERIGMEDNFFEMGGHSLLATQIIARIRTGFGVQLPLHSFLATPTIAEVTKKLAECPAIESEDETIARLLQELDGISEEEAQALLDAEMGK